MNEKQCPVWEATCFPKRCDRLATHNVVYHDDGYENRKTVWFCDQHILAYKLHPETVWW